LRQNSVIQEFLVTAAEGKQQVGMARLLTNAGGHMQTLASIKFLTQLLDADGRLAELEGRNDDAVGSYVDAIKLGNAISHGGLMIDQLVGNSCEAIGLRPLAKLAPTLSLDQSRQLMTELEAIEGRWISRDEVWRNEKALWRHELRQSPTPMMLIEIWRSGIKNVKHAQERDSIVLGKLRLIAKGLALRCGQQPPAVPSVSPP